MGALHDGHMSLVRLAKRRAAKVVVSIFVNPTQFAPTEDFGSYPRAWTADVAKLAAENVELIGQPDVKNMYPKRFATKILPEDCRDVRHAETLAPITSSEGPMRMLVATKLGTTRLIDPIGAACTACLAGG